MQNNSTFNEQIKPSLVLVLLCLVAAIALSQIYTITKPIIEKNAAKAADEARAVVLAEGDAFTPYDGELVDGVTEYYSANNGAGVAVTATAKSYGGLMTVMVGIDANGKITGVEVTNHSDTPGLGTKAMTVDYLSQYIGKTTGEIVTEDSIKNNKNLDAITGATISSNGVYHSVQEALKQFDAAGGVK
ncbi:RnfABCDGE type electron transport complex subunit G [Clostridium aminobutyricum]|uniref:Ion-translocating oxidoreductase complex subunit G n=1 Tax=Clostridium aminobutyricum TaxID=33953 RepID=A0A939IJ51_CLOAM|nr:RnfABCDGE type electron transport complex subunit G [Clostridium aminobutyricum]MBN7773204.1 RnfABCDGE type electron transport complex subunit G [Clostridium aminobutyricum]